jgi:hypothetical protein
MARKATVNREVVLQMLREGKTSQIIADQFGVSRQAIDLYRKQFTTAGLLTGQQPARPFSPLPGIETQVRQAPPVRQPVGYTPSLDQMVDLIIEAFDAKRRIPEIQAEMEQYKRRYEEALKEVEELKLKEQKRREQEARWIHAQNPGIITNP